MEHSPKIGSMKKLAIESRARENLSRYYSALKDAGYIRDFEIGRAVAGPVQDDAAHRLSLALLGDDIEPQWNVVVEATVAMHPPSAEIHFQFLATTQPDTGEDNDRPAIT